MLRTGLLCAMMCLAGGPCLADEKAPTTNKTVMLKDDFRDPAFKLRSPARGDWKFADGVARCTQDEELYKKNKDHGPIIWYKTAFDNGVIHFSFQPDKCKTFVFTLNGEKNHVFRFVSSEKGTTVVAFLPNEKEKEKENVPLKRDGPALKQGQWTDVTIEVRGPKAIVKIGKDYTALVEHPAVAQGKVAVGLAFSFGTLSVKDFSIEP